MDPDEVARLIARGEGRRLEFKESFAAENQAIESLCAFANAQGGTVLFGVRDDGTVVGVSLGRNTLTGFSNKLRQNTQPPLAPTVEEVHLPGGTVVAVEVAGHQPGQLFMAFGKAFIRVGKSNHVMTPDEMRARLLEASTDEPDEPAPTAIQLEALPPTPDNHVQLLLKNDGPAQDFVVDVIDFENIEEPQQRYVMKWRGHAPEARAVYRGGDAVLDVAQVTPPEVNPAGVQNAVRRGSFRLFSTSLPAGWEVHAGRSGWIPISEAAKQTDPFEDWIALKLRVTGSQGAKLTCRVTIGFNRPGAGDHALWVRVDDWPETTSEEKLDQA